MAMVFLRVASIVALLQGAGHALAIVTWAPKRGHDEVAVLEAMTSHAFVFQGFTRSYWDFFFGYGLLVAFTCFVEAGLFWQLAALVTSHTVHVRSIVVLFLFANVVYACLSWRYFFFTPMILDLIIAVCLTLALATLIHPPFSEL